MLLDMGRPLRALCERGRKKGVGGARPPIGAPLTARKTTAFQGARLTKHYEAEYGPPTPLGRLAPSEADPPPRRGGNFGFVLTLTALLSLRKFSDAPRMLSSVIASPLRGGRNCSLGEQFSGGGLVASERARALRKNTTDAEGLPVGGSCAASSRQVCISAGKSPSLTTSLISHVIGRR
jgi:hypothetical protein